MKSGPILVILACWPQGCANVRIGKKMFYFDRGSFLDVSHARHESHRDQVSASQLSRSAVW